MNIFNGISPEYEFNNGFIFNLDSVDFLRAIDSESVDVVFADPPYNIKKAEWDNFTNQEEYIAWSLEWIKEASRILKPTGTMYICGFTEILADLKRPSMRFFSKCKWLIWYYENKANLGKDWGRSHESILCFRKSAQYVFNIDDIRIPYNAHTLKYPNRVQGETSHFSHTSTKVEWRPNELGAKPKDVIALPTTCNGMMEKTKHPTQKPEALLRKLLLACSNENDIIVDPFSGSGTAAVVATQLKCSFLANDFNKEYNEWAKNRITNVIEKTRKQWIEYDKKIALRREKIK